jgi:predicted lipoprotein with Yx(FWY)xxD motif
MKTTDRDRARRVPSARLVSAALAVGAVSMLPAVAAGAATGGKVKVSEEKIGSMGEVLVIKGKAVYTLSPAGSKCTGECLKIWPVVAAKSVTAGSGVKKSSLSVTTNGGTHQVTYKGQPVYWFSGDTMGQVNGNITDQWGTWTAVVVAKPKGTSTAAPSTSTPTTSGGSGGTSGSGSGGSNAGGGGVNF